MDKNMNVRKFETETDFNESTKEKSIAEKEANAAVMDIIALAGTHTSSTSTEPEDDEAGCSTMTASSSRNAERYKHVTFDDIQTVQSANEFVEVLKSSEGKEKTTKTTKGNKHKRNAKQCEPSEFAYSEADKVTAKRMKINHEETIVCGVHLGQVKVETLVGERGPEPKPEESNPTTETPIEISERFRQIMEMFDNFTKNLESLEVPVNRGDSPLGAVNGQIAEEPTARTNYGKTITEDYNQNVQNVHTDDSPFGSSKGQIVEVRTTDTEAGIGKITNEDYNQEVQDVHTDGSPLRPFKEQIREEPTEDSNYRKTITEDYNQNVQNVHTDDSPFGSSKGQIVEVRTTDTEAGIGKINKEDCNQEVPKIEENKNVREETITLEVTETPPQKVTESETVSPVKANNDYIIDIEDWNYAYSEVHELPQLPQIGVATEVPRWRQVLGCQSAEIAAAPRKDSATSTRSENTSATISCQTSLHKHVVPVFESPGPVFKSPGPVFESPVPVFDSPGPSAAFREVEPPKATSMLAVQKPVPSDRPSYSMLTHMEIHVPPTNEDGCRVDTFIVGPPIPVPPIMPPGPFRGDPLAATSISQQTLVKVSESTSMIDAVAAPQTATDRTFHTIHIDTTSSPTSSVMRRPPLCMRCWRVLTDLFGAICLCLQVNKDCIFCLGFFVVFVVSASFLTAFFYRTLSINPQFFQPPPPQQLSLSNSPHDPTFYYY